MRQRHDQLTDLDLALLDRLSRGDGYKQIAFDRGVCDAAIRMQLAKVVKIIGARNRIHAVALFVEKHRKPTSPPGDQAATKNALAAAAV